MSNKIPDPQLPARRPARQRNAFAQAAAMTVEAPASTPRSDEQARPAPAPAPAPISDAPIRPSSTPQAEVASPTDTKDRSKRMEGTRDILLSMPISQKQRMEATIAHTQAFTGVKHQQVFIRTAVQKLCEQLEAQYNEGERFPLPPSGPNI